MSIELQQFSGLLDASIADLVRRRALLALPVTHVLVTSLDSVSDLGDSEIGQRLLNRFPGSAKLGRAVVVPGELLSDVAFASAIFCGFDEIWLFDREPAATKPERVTIVPPPTFDADPPPPEVSAWMSLSGCILGLADGAGTNFVTLDSAARDVVLAADGR